MSLQSPMQTAAERVADSAPQLGIATQMENLQSARIAAADHRRRLADSHRWEAEALGQTVAESPEEEPVGNLVVTGDIYGTNAAEIIQALQAASPAAAAAPLPTAAGSLPAATAEVPATQKPADLPARVAADVAAVAAGAKPAMGYLTKAAVIAALMGGGGGLGAGILAAIQAATAKPAAVKQEFTKSTTTVPGWEPVTNGAKP